MSQFGSTLATASPKENIVRIDTDSNNDVSYFEFQAQSNDKVYYFSRFVTRGTLLTGNNQLYEIVDATDTPIYSKLDANAEDVGFVDIPTSGTYYFKVTVTNEIGLQLSVSINLDSDSQLDFENSDFIDEFSEAIIFAENHNVADPISFQEKGFALETDQRRYLGVPANDYYAGTGIIRGFLTVDGEYTTRKVRLYAKEEGILLSTTYSDPVTGYYEFRGYATPTEKIGAEYFTTGHDYERLENAAIADFLLAETV